MTRFLALFDVHYGQEVKDGRTRPIHDQKALDLVLKFATDFKPKVVILGGDILDCGSVSRHHEGLRRPVEGLRLHHDAQALKRNLLDPLERICRTRIYIKGNHEAWLDLLVDRYPGLEGLVSVETLVGPRWKVVPQGGSYRLGKLHFLHGDQIRGTAHPAKWAVEAYERSVRFGHFHKAQLHSKISAFDATDVRTGMAVPALCRRDPGYGRGAPNQWSLGFLWGYVLDDGNFSDYLTIISDGRFVANGRTYR